MEFRDHYGNPAIEIPDPEPRRGIETGLFAWKELQENVVECMMYSDCTFLKDFGPWKKDQVVDLIWINFDQSTFTVSNEGKEQTVNIGLCVL